jgi:hypothetical protein
MLIGVRVTMATMAMRACKPAWPKNPSMHIRLTADIARKRDVVATLADDQGRCAVAFFRPIILSERIRHAVSDNLAFGRIFVLMRMCMPPKHELLDDEEHPEPDNQRSSDGMRPTRPYALHCLGQQSQQRGADQSARRKAHEMRQQAEARLLRQQ